MPQPPAPIPRAPYAITMMIATVLATLACAGAAIATGAPTDAVAVLAGVIVFAGLLSLVALIGPPLIAPEYWGLVVLGITGVHMFMALGAMLVLIEVAGYPRRPVVFGLLSGTVLLLVFEAAAAVVLLNKRERDRAALRSLA